MHCNEYTTPSSVTWPHGERLMLALQEYATPSSATRLATRLHGERVDVSITQVCCTQYVDVCIARVCEHCKSMLQLFFNRVSTARAMLTLIVQRAKSPAMLTCPCPCCGVTGTVLPLVVLPRNRATRSMCCGSMNSLLPVRGCTSVRVRGRNIGSVALSAQTKLGLSVRSSGSRHAQEEVEIHAQQLR